MGCHKPLGFTYNLSAVLRRLGQEGRSTRWGSRYVQSMVDDASIGFPAPLPLLVGGSLSTRVHSNSSWPVDAVDAWLQDRTPPGGVSAHEQAERREAADDMDANAAALAAEIHGRNVIAFPAVAA